MPSFAWSSDVCRSEEHTSELQSLTNIVCRLLLEKKTHLLWETPRARVRVSRRIRTVRFQGSILLHFAAGIRAAVEELTPVELFFKRVGPPRDPSPSRAERFPD